MKKTLTGAALAALLATASGTGCSYRDARSLAKTGGVMLVAGAISGAVAASRADGPASASLDTIALSVAGGLFATGGLIVGAGGLIGMSTSRESVPSVTSSPLTLTASSQP